MLARAHQNLAPSRALLVMASVWPAAVTVTADHYNERVGSIRLVAGMLGGRRSSRPVSHDHGAPGPAHRASGTYAAARQLPPGRVAGSDSEQGPIMAAVVLILSTTVLVDRSTGPPLFPLRRPVRTRFRLSVRLRLSRMNRRPGRGQCRP